MADKRKTFDAQRESEGLEKKKKLVYNPRSPAYAPPPKAVLRQRWINARQRAYKRENWRGLWLKETGGNQGDLDAMVRSHQTSMCAWTMPIRFVTPESCMKMARNDDKLAKLMAAYNAQCVLWDKQIEAKVDQGTLDVVKTALRPSMRRADMAKSESQRTKLLLEWATHFDTYREKLSEKRPDLLEQLTTWFDSKCKKRDFKVPGRKAVPTKPTETD